LEKNNHYNRTITAWWFWINCFSQRQVGQLR